MFIKRSDTTLRIVVNVTNRLWEIVEIVDAVGAWETSDWRSDEQPSVTAGLRRNPRAAVSLPTIAGFCKWLAFSYPP
jgi:hypothetical protein